jgi:hypothetical protein
VRGDRSRPWSSRLVRFSPSFGDQHICLGIRQIEEVAGPMAGHVDAVHALGELPNQPDAAHDVQPSLLKGSRSEQFGN